MPNLVGIGNSQVPTNAMLGGLAYQDPDHAVLDNVELGNIAAINTRNEDNTQGLFVYNTALDSDGGAWRKRCNHTSWYNERLGSVWRGNRREFPSIAVLVATNTRLNVYDGDDPNLPLWRSFYYSNKAQNSYTNNGLSAMNGKICIGFDGVFPGLGTIDLIADWFELRDERNSNATNRRVYNPIAKGVSVEGASFLTPKLALNGDQINGLAMTVLPGAPIDQTTGLPVVTLAAACDTGVTIVTYPTYDNSRFRNGTEWTMRTTKTLTGGIENHFIDFLSDGKVLVEQGYQYTSVYRSYNSESQAYTSSMSHTEQYSHLGSGWEEIVFPPVGTVSSTPAYILTATKDGGFASGHTGLVVGAASLILVDRNDISPTNGMICGITTHNNSGWMFGDCSLATLSDTNPTNLDSDASNLITGQNHNYDTDTSENWTSQPNASAVHDASEGVGSSGCIKMDSNGGSNIYSTIEFTGLTIGKQYGIRFQAKHSAGSVTSSFKQSTALHNTGTTFASYSFAPGTSYSEVIMPTFKATTTSVWLSVYANNGGSGYLYLDEFYLNEAIQDHSPNQNGVQVIGSLTVKPVEAGSDLVSYGGWSTSNYIRQQYNSHLDYGTGDWCYYFWMNPNDSSSGSVIFTRWSYNIDGSTAGRTMVYFNSGILRFDLTDDGASSYDGNAGMVAIQESLAWHFVCVGRRGNTAEMWIDGVMDQSFTLVDDSNGSYTRNTAVLEIGHSPNSGSPDGGMYLSLFRSSAKMPSPNQIQKIYHDEKALFGVNAKCTIHGNATPVKALAYDKVTDILHVGTTEGRNEFSGLRRINNTTTGVTYDISASGGVIAEQ